MRIRSGGAAAAFVARVGHPVRLGHGEAFYQPDPTHNDFVGDDERDLLLYAVRRSACVVPDTLRSDVFPVWRTTAASAAAHPQLLDSWASVRVAGRTFRPQLRPLRIALVAWARGWHLDAPWVLETALRTLDMWMTVPQARDALRWSRSLSVVRPALSDSEETAWRHGRELHEFVGAWLRRRRNVRPTPVKRNPAHYVWLVQRQVLGLTWPRIAHLANADDHRTVLDAVQDTAARLGLRLRVGRRGRPPSEARLGRELYPAGLLKRGGCAAQS